MVAARRIRSEKLKEHQYREGYARSLEGKELEWDKDNNFEHMWKQVKQEMIESTREVCGSVKEGGEGKNPNSVWWTDKVKPVVRRKETAWKVLAVRDVEAKKRFMEVYRERLKAVYIRPKRK